jgi:phytoene dehydrogenase-like protein
MNELIRVLLIQINPPAVNHQLSTKKDYDAVVVGSGPNGLAAAITLQKAGLSVLILEAKSRIGGGMRSGELTLAGFTHDICSAVHPMAADSPFFQSLSLADHGLKFLYPEIPLVHPFDDGTSFSLRPLLENMYSEFANDGAAYQELMQPIVESWDKIREDVLAPFHFPKHPIDMARFGWRALSSATTLSKRFRSEKARGFWGGLAMHSQLPFNMLASSAIGLVLLTVGHKRGWPVAQGGSQAIADTLASCFKSMGGKIELNQPIKSMDQIPSSRAVLLDITPIQLLEIAGQKLSPFYRGQLKKFRYGMGVFKIDWALSESIPFKSTEARLAGTIHLGGSFNEIEAGEKDAWNGRHAEAPGVILAQPSIIDSSRAPEGKHTAWAYCHVPGGSIRDMTTAIENQVERFAPGFRERILARHTLNTEELEQLNNNYYRGDIGGGANNLSQLFTRPALRSAPYRTSAKGIYLCSSSTPPGGGVHGMCGYHAARRALKEIFNT